jgi:hypothetical protein
LIAAETVTEIYSDTQYIVKRLSEVCKLQLRCRRSICVTSYFMSTTLQTCPFCGRRFEVSAHQGQQRCPRCGCPFDFQPSAVGEDNEANPETRTDGFQGFIQSIADPDVVAETAMAGIFGGLPAGVILGIIDGAIRAAHQPNVTVGWISMLGGAVAGFLFGFVLGTLVGVLIAVAVEALGRFRRVPVDPAAIMAGALAGLGASVSVAGLAWMPVGVLVGTLGGLGWLALKHRVRPEHFNSALHRR